MTQRATLLCIGLTTVDVVALSVHIQPFEGVGDTSGGFGRILGLTPQPITYRIAPQASL